MWRGPLLALCLSLASGAAHAASLVSPTTAAARDDQVLSLPGWEGALPSKQFSGLVSTGSEEKNATFHYWLVESEGDPTSDPLVVWMNGGPGRDPYIT